MHAQLPGKLQTIKQAGISTDRSLDEFVMRIGELTGTDDAGQARELTHAVLGALAEHGSGGQARDLAAMLPPDARTAAAGSERAQHTDSDDFFAELTNQVSVTTPDLVRDHTAGVLQVLRRWAPAELANTLDQLPAEVRQLAR